MTSKIDDLMVINITLPEIYILTRVINRIYNKFNLKEIDISIIEPHDIVNSFRMIPGIKIERIPEEIKYTIVKNLRDLETSETNDFYDRKLRDNINRIFDIISYDSKESKLKILKTIFDEIKPYKLHYPQCSIFLLPYTLIMIREWIKYVNQQHPNFLSSCVSKGGEKKDKIEKIEKTIVKDNKKYEFSERSNETMINCIFQNKKCYKCDTGKLSNFTLCSKDLGCENIKCNYKYKVYLHKQDETENIKEDNNKYCYLVIKNTNIEVIDYV